jgi:hypothetical protein
MGGLIWEALVGLAPSPAATSSLVVARMIAGQAEAVWYGEKLL